MKMIVKVATIKFNRFFKISSILDYNVKKYLNINTGNNYMEGKILNLIYEFRFIHGKRYSYKHEYKKDNLNNVIDKLIGEMIKPVKDFIDLIVIYIEKE